MLKNIDFSKVDKKLEIVFKFFHIIRYVWMLLLVVDLIHPGIYVFGALTWIMWYIVILAIYSILAIFVYRTQK